MQRQNIILIKELIQLGFESQTLALFEKYLSEEIEYSSESVENTIISRHEVIGFLTKKFNAIQNSKESRPSIILLHPKYNQPNQFYVLQTFHKKSLVLSICFTMNDKGHINGIRINENIIV